MNTTKTPTKDKKKKRQSWPRISEETHKNGTRAFMVDGRIFQNGKRVGERFFYPTRAEAETKQELLRLARKNNGKDAAAFPEKLRHEALDCSIRLAAVGATLTEATEYYLKNAKPQAGTIKAEDLVEKFLTDRKANGCRAEYIRVQGVVLNKFAKAFPEREIHELRLVEITDWMNGQRWQPRTRENYQKDVSKLFRFAVGRGYCAINPMEKAGEIKYDEPPPCILTVEEAEKLLKAAQEHREGYLAPFVSIALFAGLRVAEISKLDWRNISIEQRHIEVPAHVAKGRSRRSVTMSDNLARWLALYVKESGPVTPQPSNFIEKRFGLLRKHAGFIQWGKNSMRHSFASYHVQKHQNAPMTSLQMGHDNPNQLFENYKNTVTAAAAEKYWSLVPQS